MIVLFDIDGTLIDTAGAGLHALTGGFQIAYADEIGDQTFPPIDLRGATDSGIVRDLFKHFGLDARDVQGREELFHSHYLERLRANLKNSEEACLLEGADSLLGLLAAGDEHDLGLLTGNIEQAAWLKLQHFDIAHPFQFGAFGNQHEDRNQLAGFALDAARTRLGRDITGEPSVVIGDTPKDISAGKAIGALTIAVATGGFPASALAEHKPDHLFEDFSDPQAVANVLAD